MSSLSFSIPSTTLSSTSPLVSLSWWHLKGELFDKEGLINEWNGIFHSMAFNEHFFTFLDFLDHSQAEEEAKKINEFDSLSGKFH